MNPYTKRYYILILKEDGTIEKAFGNPEGGYVEEKNAEENLEIIAKDYPQTESFLILPLWENL